MHERSWLRVEGLPKYTLELNDIERCWRDLKQNYLANRTFTDVLDLDRAIHQAIVSRNQERKGDPSAKKLPKAG